MKVMVIGTPDWDDELRVHAALVTVNVTMRVNNEPMWLVHANDNRVDRAAIEAAAELGWGREVHHRNPSDGNLQDARRTVRMLETRPDLLLAFHKEDTRRIRHAWETAGKMGIPRKAHVPYVP